MCYPLDDINFFPLDRDALLNNWGQVWIVYFLPYPIIVACFSGALAYSLLYYSKKTGSS